jgi:hypothetical protein
VLKWVRRISFAFLTVVVLAVLAGFTYEQVGRARDANQLPPRVGQPVDIGGRTLNACRTTLLISLLPKNLCVPRG